jgi:hypothetical protein
MSAPPSVAPFAAQLSDLATDLRRGVCCLVVCDKGWALPIFQNVRQRLKVAELRCEFLDGRPARGEEPPTDAGVMLSCIAQLRKVVRGDVNDAVYVLPHLDVMTTTDGGWTTISREVIPLLYENTEAVWLGFQDPSLPLFPLVEKLFPRRYVIETPFRAAITTPPEPFPPPVPVPPPEPEVRVEPSQLLAPEETQTVEPEPAAEVASPTEPEQPSPAGETLPEPAPPSEPPDTSAGPTSASDAPG